MQRFHSLSQDSNHFNHLYHLPYPLFILESLRILLL